LRKPFELGVLERTIEQALGRRRGSLDRSAMQ
jgi:hypothetical protein